MASKGNLKRSLASLPPWPQQSLPVTVLQLFKTIAKEVTESDDLPAEGLLLQLAIIEGKNPMDIDYISADVAAAIMELVSQLKRDKKGIEVSLCLLLCLVLLLNDWEPPPLEESEETSEGDSEGSEDADSAQVSAPPTIPLPAVLFSKLASVLKDWWEKAGPATHISIPLLRMIYVILSIGPRSKSLPRVVTFVDSNLSVLVTYSTDGYLSDNPTAFFQELLEFISSLAEQGIDPIVAIQTNLPNLFGPVFGVRSHAVSCLILEYGYLAICSQHKKALLGEGLHFLVKVWKLFPPLDLARAQSMARLQHLESLCVCREVLEDLITLLPISKAPASSESGSFQQGGSGVAVEADSVKKEGCGMRHVLSSDSALELSRPVTDEERHRDKAERVGLLVDLLRLACAIVSGTHSGNFLLCSLPWLANGLSFNVVF